MEATQGRPPEYDAPRSPEAVVWPSVPSHDPEKSEVTLPNIRTALSADLERKSPSQDVNSPRNPHASPRSNGSLPRIDPGRTWSDAQKEDTTMASPVDTGSVVSADERTPNERMVAETLSEMRNSDVRSSRSQSMNGIANGSPNGTHSTEPEPILELVSQVHPWVGGTINASVSAYTTTKYYSPRIVQWGVQAMERNVGTPVFSAVGSVGRFTGIEGNIRRHLEDRRPGDLERNAGSAMEIDGQDTAVARLGRNGEQLPAYGASRPPSYREEESPASVDRTNGVATRDRPPANRSWSSQVWVTTSGLSVALSTTSRQSLRFCLKLLADQIGNVNQLTRALSMLLQDYEETRRRAYNTDSAMEKGQRPSTPDRDEGARRIAESIRQTSENIWQALRQVTTAVSNYCGGALPDNARQFVRAQLLSLPARWRLVTQSHTSESNTTRAAQRMIDFAGQGLDMMSEVSGVLQATLESAEGWLARVGRQDQQDTTMQDVDAASNEKQPSQQPESQPEKS
ncbi:Hypothetical predicted protein [Lecanosticta acicola]|uniref:Opi1-domain-containing protein n=1 Tax=Lecanosticta acicola TaxID=111012 RepID=A0AAI8YSR0_9PEZI|nr:Hypothetical predicted protein [Lecanosticta acicola]